MSGQSIIIRADASAKNGGGHVMRCLNLARELEAQGATVRWACSRETLDVMPAVKSFNPIVVCDTDMQNGTFFDDAEQTAQANRIKEAIQSTGQNTGQNTGAKIDAVIVDQYFLSAPFQDALKGFASKIVAIDEKINRRHSADIIVDFIPHAPDEWHKSGHVKPETTLLSGPAYKMLSPLFQEKAKERKRIKATFQTVRVKEKRVVITSGAVDGVNLIGRVLKAIASDITLKKNMRYDIPLFSSAPHIKDIRHAVTTMKSRGFNIHLHENCTTVSDLMKQADLNIGSASAAAFEAGAIGGVAGIYYDCGHMQDKIGRLVLDKSGGFYMGHHSHFGPGLLLNRMRQILDNPSLTSSRQTNSARICDGQGAKRVASRILASLTQQQTQQQPQARHKRYHPFFDKN